MTVEWLGPKWLQWASDQNWTMAKVFIRVTEVELGGTYLHEANAARLGRFSHLRKVILKNSPDANTRAALVRLKAAQRVQILGDVALGTG